MSTRIYGFPLKSLQSKKEGKRKGKKLQAWGGSVCIRTVAKRSTESRYPKVKVEVVMQSFSTDSTELTHDSELHGVLERGSRHRRVDRPAGDLHAVVGPLRTVLYHAGRHRREVLLTDLRGRMEQ